MDFYDIAFSPINNNKINDKQRNIIINKVNQYKGRRIIKNKTLNLHENKLIRVRIRDGVKII